VTEFSLVNRLKKSYIDTVSAFKISDLFGTNVELVFRKGLKYSVGEHILNKIWCL